MKQPPKQSAADRLKAALEMHEFGVSMMRQNLRRKHATADPQEIESMLSAWLHGGPFLWLPASWPVSAEQREPN